MELAGMAPLEDNPGFTANAPNITPDEETGIGNWTDDEIMISIREGRRPDGTIIGPPMPIGLYRNLSDNDVQPPYPEALSAILGDWDALFAALPILGQLRLFSGGAAICVPNTVCTFESGEGAQQSRIPTSHNICFPTYRTRPTGAVETGPAMS